MKKLFALLAVVLLYSNLLAQHPTPPSAINMPAMTQVLPPAPNAFEMTRYSGMPVNLSTGSVNQTISLGAVTQGKLSAPVSLSYQSGNGIKVDQIASRVGMGWVLNAGGVVTRSVANKPDEFSTWMDYPAPTASNDAMWNYLNEASGPPGWPHDTEPDVFSYNFSGYSGQFILDPHYRSTKIIHLAASPLKVLTNFNSSSGWNIKIITPDGTEYYFGGPSATETSKTSPDGAGCGKNYDSPLPTAWYLTKIRSYAGEEINFNYTPVTFTYHTSSSQTQIRTPQNTLSQYYYYTNWYSQNLITTPDTVAPSQMMPCPSKTQDQNCASIFLSNGVRLYEIVSATSRATFSVTAKPDAPGDVLYTGVTFEQYTHVMAQGTQTSKSYSFSYINSNNAHNYNPSFNNSAMNVRPFLALVSGPGNETYKMNYYNIDGLPARLSFSQDYWGYFNGSNNATSFIPRSTNADEANIFPNANADRQPRGDYAKYGLLSSISYPTGGRDSLIWEPNTVYESRLQLPPIAYLNATVQGTGWNGANTQTYYLSVHNSRPVNISLATLLGPGSTDYYHQSCVFSLVSTTGYTVISGLKIVPEQSYGSTITLPEGTYILTMRAEGEAAIGTAEIVYQPNGTFVTTNYEVGGVRLARNLSRPLMGTPFEKRFVYAALATQTQSSGKVAHIPKGNEYYADLPIHTGDDFKQCMYKAAYTNPLYSLTFFSGGHIYYRDVIELKGGNWENGGVAHRYTGGDGLTAYPVAGQQMHGMPMDNIGYPAGLETSALTFKKTGNNGGVYTTMPVAETKTTYKYDERVEVVNEAYVVRRKWNNLNVHAPLFDYELKPFDVARYKLNRQWIYPDTVTTIAYDDEGGNPIVTTQVTLYGNTSHLQPTEVKQTMSDGRTKRVVMTYPDEMIANGQVTPYTTLRDAQFRTGLVTSQASYIDNVLQETVSTSYRDFGASVIEPDTIRYSQGTGTAANMVNFHHYDGNARLVTQSRNKGPKTSYRYGYGGRLIAECTNADANEFFFESFDESTGGMNGTGHTGNRHSVGDYTIPWYPPTTNRPYVVRYWYLQSGKWFFKEEPLVQPMVLTLGEAVDDVGIYPADAQLRTWTYAPLSGIASMTDEKGNTTYYEYDDAKRLQHIRDNNLDIVKSYTYQLVGPQIEYFNTLQSQVFTKACSTGTGTSHTYTVPAGIYTSTVSQADANNQALADVAANGQAYANANGSCVTGNISLSYVNNVSGSSITSLVVKDGLGTVLYTFTNAQLTAGISIPQGTYTFVFTVAGTNWGTLWLGAGSYFGSTENTSSSSYSITGVNLVATTGTIYLDGFF